MNSKIISDQSKNAIISLAYPVQLADKTLDQVTMRRPNMGDLLDHEPRRIEDVAQELTLIGILCNLKLEEMRLLDSTDYGRLQEQYMRFRTIPKPEASA